MQKKFFVALLATMAATSLATASCEPAASSTLPSTSTTPPVDTVLPPEEEPEVNALQIKYNDKKITGTLEVNLSLGTLNLVIDIDKEEGYVGDAVLDSSDKSVATIAADGKVTLLKAGETIISASIDNLKESFVLIVNEQAPSLEEHTITVIGGTSSVKTAKAGEYVTLTATIPEHKEFIAWTFDGDDEIWQNGNVFKMPDRDITVTGEYDDMKYTLNVIGAKVIDNEGDVVPGGEVTDDKEGEFEDITTYEFTYDTEISLRAVDAPEGMIFVGFDYGVKNNRVGELGETEYGPFTMPDDTLTVWAVFSDFKTRLVPAGTANPFDSAAGHKDIESGTPANEANDPDLEGLSGYRMAIPANSAKNTDMPENINSVCDLDTVANGTTLVKTIFKNHHETLPISVEFYATYYGNITTTGTVTVQPGEVVTKYFLAGLGINLPWMGVAIKEDVGGSSGDVVLLDMVCGTAAYYPDGDKSLTVSGNPQYVTVGSWSAKNQWNGSRPCIVNNSVGLTAIGARNQDFNGTSTSGRPTNNAYVTTQITNLPAFDAANPETTVYAKIVNNVNQYAKQDSDFKIAISQTDDPINDDTATIYDFKLVELAQTELFAFTFDRFGDNDTYYVSIIKPEAEPEDDLYAFNFCLQMTYNNVMGYEE